MPLRVVVGAVGGVTNNMSKEANSAQIYEQRLTDEYGYPGENILKEVPYAFGKARYRLDLVVTREGKPYIIVEVKARPRLDNGKDQLVSYSRATDAGFAVLTDGYTDHCFRVLRDAYETRLEAIPDIPSYQRTLEDIGMHPNSELISIEPSRLEEIIFHSLEIIRSNESISTEQASREILKILALKVYDESTHPEKGLFRAHFGEPVENVKSRISALAMQAIKEYPSVLEDPPALSPESLSMLVYTFQKYSLRSSGGEIAGSRLPVELLGRHSLKFSTPRDLVKVIADLLDPEAGSTFADPACGVGGVLTEAATRGCRVTGMDININITHYAKLNLALSGFPGNVFALDSLGELDSAILQRFPDGGFDYAAVVPPFGETIRDSRLDHFRLGSHKKMQSIEALFLERTLELLKPGGKMVIVLPEGFLSNASTLDVREYILKQSTVKAIISLPVSTFSPHFSVKTSLLLLERSPNRGTTQDDDVFVGIVKDSNADSIAANFRAFRDKSVNSFGEDFFVTKLKSATQMDAGYLKGLRHLDTWVHEYPLVELQKIAGLTSGVRLTRIGKEDPNGSLRYIRAGDVQDLMLNLEQSERISVNPDVPLRTAEPGDILMTRAGTVGRVALVEDGSISIVVGSNVMRIRVHKKKPVIPKYLLAYLRSSHGQRQMDMYISGSAIKALNISGLRRLKIPVPSIEQQRKVASKIDEIMEKRREVTQVLRELKVKKAQLLSELDDLIMED